jgi:hypothetical protein
MTSVINCVVRHENGSRGFHGSGRSSRTGMGQSMVDSTGRGNTMPSTDEEEKAEDICDGCDSAHAAARVGDSILAVKAATIIHSWLTRQTQVNQQNPGTIRMTGTISPGTSVIIPGAAGMLDTETSAA